MTLKKRKEYDKFLRSSEGNLFQEWKEPDLDLKEAEDILRFANTLLGAFLKEQKKRIELGALLADAANALNWKLVEDLVKEGASLNEIGKNYNTALHVAVIENDIQRIEWLIS